MATVGLVQSVRQALGHSLHVPRYASSREIRRDGAIAAAVGLVVVVVSGAVPFLLVRAGAPTGASRGVLVLILAGWALLVIGSYRALTGRHPDQESHTSAASLGRISMMVGVIIGAVAALVGLMFVVLFVLGID